MEKTEKIEEKNEKDFAKIFICALIIITIGFGGIKGYQSYILKQNIAVEISYQRQLVEGAGSQEEAYMYWVELECLVAQEDELYRSPIGILVWLILFLECFVLYQKIQFDKLKEKLLNQDLNLIDTTQS